MSSASWTSGPGWISPAPSNATHSTRQGPGRRPRHHRDPVMTAHLAGGEARPGKAFGTLSAGSLSAAARREPERAVLFYAADDDAAGEEVADLIRIAGYEPVRVGGLDQSIRIEMFGDLHEYGALGRVVTKSEALEAI